MDYKQAISEVLAIVKRPDKVSEIKWAVNAAIADLVRSDKFSFDLYEVEIAVVGDSMFQAIDYTQFATRPRHIESLHTDTDQKPYIEIKPRNIAVGGERKGIYYKRNNGLQIKMRTSANTIKIAYYVIPPTLSADTDTHWTLEQAPAEIVGRACFHVFSTIGQDKDAAQWERKSMLAFDAVAKELT